MTKLEKIIQLTSALLLLTGLYSIVWLYSFYVRGFGIPIFQYLDPSEVLFFSPATLLAWGLPLLIVSVFIGFIIFLDFFENRKGTWLLLAPLILLGFVLLIIVVIGFFNGTYTIDHSVFFNEIYQDRIMTIFGITLLVITLPTYISTKLLNKKLIKDSRLIYLTGFLLATVFFAYSEGMIHAMKVKVNETDIKLTLKRRSGASIKTDGSVVYLGKSKEYLFLYYPNIKTTRVLNYSDIDEVEIKLLD